MSDKRKLRAGLNIYERICARVKRVGGVDLELPPRVSGRDPPDFDAADYDPPPTHLLVDATRLNF